MPDIQFNFREGGGSEEEILFGRVEIKSTLVHSRGTSLVLTKSTTWDIIDGLALATNVQPTPEPVDGQIEWAYEVTAHDRKGDNWQWLVGVPNVSGAVAFVTLPRYFETKPPLFGQGPKGEPGETATIAVGTVSGGTTAQVTNSGTPNEAVLNFVLPKGDKGDTGTGVPTGGTALQYIRKNAGNTTTEWATLNKASVGLSNVDNTSDANKPISTATQTALTGLESRTDANVATLASNEASLVYEAIKEGFVVRGDNVVNVKDFGALGDGVSDDLSSINDALASGGNVYIPEGVYMVSGEVEVPSNTRLFGAGVDKTIVRTMATSLVNLNTITNAKNNRTERTDYDENILIEHLTVDGNAWARPNGSTQTQGSSIKFSTVRNSAINDVKAINAPLHCVDIMASVYQSDATSNVNTVVVGPSYGILINNVRVADSKVDDGITTHGSHDITILGCYAWRTQPALENQQGIEVDEGSYRVRVISCYVNGWTKGYQAKGHDYTTPAYDVSFIGCTAENCTFGFDVSHINPASIPSGQVSWARNVFITDCKVINPVQQNEVYSELRAVQIRAYKNVVITNLALENGIHNNITIDAGASGVRILGLYAENVMTAPPYTDRGIIHLFNSAGADHTFNNITITTPLSVPVITSNAGGHAVKVDGIRAMGTTSDWGCVVRSSIQKGDSVKNINQTGYLCDFHIQAGSFAGTYNNIILEPGWFASFTGNTVPNGTVNGWPSAVYHQRDGAVNPMWVKHTGNGNTGWRAVAYIP